MPIERGTTVVTMSYYSYYYSRTLGAAYLKVGEVRDGVDSDLAGSGPAGAG